MDTSLTEINAQTQLKTHQKREIKKAHRSCPKRNNPQFTPANISLEFFPSKGIMNHKITRTFSLPFFYKPSFRRRFPTKPTIKASRKKELAWKDILKKGINIYMIKHRNQQQEEKPTFEFSCFIYLFYCLCFPFSSFSCS